jgi:hypothetical protein
MADKYRALREFTYPDAKSLKGVLAAGGLSKMTPEQREAVTFKRVAVGESCDDMPADSLAVFLARGAVEVVPGKKVKP